MEDKAKRQRCSARVYPNTRWGAFHGHQCEKMGVVQRDGKWYCKVHDPEYKKQKAEKRTEAYNKAHETRMLERRAAAACRAINPSNPMAVAGKMLDAFDVCKSLTALSGNFFNFEDLKGIMYQAEQCAAITKPAKTRG